MQAKITLYKIILYKMKQATLGKEFNSLDAFRKFPPLLVQLLKINHFNLSSLVSMQLKHTIFLYWNDCLGWVTSNSCSIQQ